MYSRLFVFLFFLLLKTQFSYLSDTNGFIIVSTTSSPSDPDNRTTKIEKLLASLSDRLDTLESQIKTLKENYASQNLQKQNSDSVSSSCKEVQQRGSNVSDFYIIQPKFTSHPILVLCDLKTRGGGWTYILNRFNGSQDFYLDWNNYKEGFGKMTGEFWLGLENIYHMTGFEINELLIELEDWNGKNYYAHYNSFSIGSESEGYSLKLLDGYSGDAGDGFSYHAGMKFSTKDRDQDLTTNINCAAVSTGAWWYNFCKVGQLTGKYMRRDVQLQDTSKSMYYNINYTDIQRLKVAKMMIKPRDNRNLYELRTIK